MTDFARLRAAAAEVLPTVVEVRRAIHRHPELAYEEFATSQLLAEVLRDHGLIPRPRTPKTGLVVEVGDGTPLVAFRADIDALPIQEPPGLPFASQVPGVMHACGHDAHAAIGIGLALLLSRCQLPGRVRLLFQPAEETFPGGAWELVREGVVDGVKAILAFHVDPGLEVGRVGLRAGPITSSTDRFFVTLEGPGGHTARPHQTVDLVYAAGRVITELPSLLPRMVDARSPVVLVFGRISGGTADNVIPTTVEMSGTCRTLDPELWDDLPGLVERLVHEVVSPVGAKAIVHYQRGIPPVVNDVGVITHAAAAIAAALGEEAVAPTAPSMGAEDFSRYLEVTPGALLRLGVGAPGRRGDLHSAGFALDESALETGLLAGAATLLRLLEESA